MSTVTRRLLLKALAAADVIVMILAGVIAQAYSTGWNSFGGMEEFLSLRIRLSDILLVASFVGAWHLAFRAQGLYRSHRQGRLRAEWWEVTRAVVTGTLLAGTVALVFGVGAIDRNFLAAFFLLAFLGTQSMRSALRVLLEEARRSGRNLRNLVVLGCGPRGSAYSREIRSRPELGYLLLGFLDDMPPPENPLNGQREKLLGPLDKTREILCSGNVDEVYIALPIKSYYEEIAKTISLCEELGIIVRLPADTFELKLAKAYVDYRGDQALLTLSTPRPEAPALALKRSIDILVSAVALLLLTPVFALVSLAIKLSNPGPVFFLQERLGLGGRRFRLIKFRTMVQDAEMRIGELEHRNEVDGAAFKLRSDPRVTNVGRYLRRFSLDELPQFFNVFMGDMSLVGPRPLPVRDVERFDANWQKRRFSVKPGLTCLWQANGRHEIGFEHWMELDLQYIDHWSLTLDIQIILKTIPAVLRGTGAT